MQNSFMRLMQNNLLMLLVKQELLTHNRTDFEELVQSYFDSRQMHYGVIFAVRRPPQEIAQRLLAILNHVTADEMQNQVRYI
jgi:hypothetical protein